MSIQSGLNTVLSGIERLAGGLRFAGQLALASMVITICYDVVMRYVFRAPTLWSLEVNTFLVLFVTLIPAGDVLASGSQLRISFFVDKLGPRSRAALERLSSLLGCAFAAVMVWKGTEMTLIAFKYDERMSTALGTPMCIPYAFIPIGFGILFLHYFVTFLIGRKPAEMEPGTQEV